MKVFKYVIAFFLLTPNISSAACRYSRNDTDLIAIAINSQTVIGDKKYCYMTVICDVDEKIEDETSDEVCQATLSVNKRAWICPNADECKDESSKIKRIAQIANTARKPEKIFKLNDIPVTESVGLPENAQ
jgi:hypothetical protein